VPAYAVKPREADAVSAAVGTIVDEFAGLVKSVARGHGLSEADIDEVMQDVRVRIWRARKREAIAGTINASYVHRTAMSAALDLIRRQRSRREESLEMTTDDRGKVLTLERDPGKDFVDRELAQQILGAVDALPDNRRPVVRMHLAGYHRSEIAQLLGWSEAKTRNLLYRGLENLRALLTERGIGPLAEA